MYERPRAWSASLVLIERMMAMLCICLAISGMCSEICTPEALVEIGLKGPPVFAPGLRSQMSIVLGPPLIHSMMAALCRFFRSEALAAMALVKLMAGLAKALAAARCLTKWRRVIPEGTADKFMGDSGRDSG